MVKDYLWNQHQHLYQIFSNQWIISNIKSGLKYLNVFNDKSTVFAGEQGNFNIIVFGQNLNEATMIIINHWNAHIWAVSCGTDLGTWKWMQLYK